jgi:serine/threonine-protein kinase
MSNRLKLAALAASLALLLVAPAAAQASWGSIAVDPETGKIGYARNEPSAGAAQSQARNECGTNHCKAAVWIFNGYGALVQKKNDLYFAGLGATKAQAFSNARKRANDGSARKIAWVFSGYS